MSIVSSIKDANNSGHGMGLLFAGLLGLLLSDIIPTPADALYFSYESKLQRDQEDGLITSKQRWIRDAVAYYGFNPLWWLLVIIIVSYVPGSAKKKLNIAVGLIAAGFVFSVIHKNIKKDEKRQLEKTIAAAKQNQPN